MYDESINLNKIKVTVITPCFNEEKYIGRCLHSIVVQDYAKDKVEVLVIDGGSVDRTKQIVKEYTQKYPFIKLLDNPKRIQTFATNTGLKIAKGNAIIRMDAHTVYLSDYISKLVYWLNRSQADCVGGLWAIRPGANSLIAMAIVFSLTHPFGVGNAYYRIGLREPKFVDTVPYGCYKKEVFDKIGLFNENLNRTDDIEFNLRLRRAEGKILLVPEIKSYYYARPDLLALAKQNFGNGFWILYSLKFAKLPFSLRHLVPFIFVSSLFTTFLLSFFYKFFIYLFAFIGGTYFIANLFFSCSIAFKKGLKYLPFLMSSFFTLHFSYGLGSICGGIKLIVSGIISLLRNLIEKYKKIETHRIFFKSKLLEQ